MSDSDIPIRKYPIPNTQYLLTITMTHTKQKQLLRFGKMLPIAILALALTLSSCTIITPTPTDVSSADVELSTFTPTTTTTATVTATPLSTYTPTPTPLPTDTPTPTPTKAATATTAPKKAAVKPAATPTPGKVTLVLKEADLNKMAQDALAEQSDVPVSNVRVDLQPGQIVFSGRAVLGFFPVNLEITATLPVVNGKPKPEIVSVKLGGEETGGFIRTQVVNMIQPYLELFAQTDLNLYVDKIVITDKEIRITGQYQ